MDNAIMENQIKIKLKGNHIAPVFTKTISNFSFHICFMISLAIYWISYNLVSLRTINSYIVTFTTVIVHACTLCKCV